MKKKEDHDHLTNSSHRQTEIQIYKISSQSIIYIKILKSYSYSLGQLFCTCKKKIQGKESFGIYDAEC
jgi:hypothetical protein